MFVLQEGHIEIMGERLVVFWHDRLLKGNSTAQCVLFNNRAEQCSVSKHKCFCCCGLFTVSLSNHGDVIKGVSAWAQRPKIFSIYSQCYKLRLLTFKNQSAFKVATWFVKKAIL